MEDHRYQACRLQLFCMLLARLDQIDPGIRVAGRLCIPKMNYSRTRSLTGIVPVIEQCLVSRSFSFCRLCRTSFRALATFYSRKWHPPNRSQCKKLQRSSRLCLKNVSRTKLLENVKNAGNRLKMLSPIEVKLVRLLIPWPSIDQSF